MSLIIKSQPVTALRYALRSLYILYPSFCKGDHKDILGNLLIFKTVILFTIAYIDVPAGIGGSSHTAQSAHLWSPQICQSSATPAKASHITYLTAMTRGFSNYTDSTAMNVTPES